MFEQKNERREMGVLQAEGMTEPTPLKKCFLSSVCLFPSFYGLMVRTGNCTS